MPTLIRTGSRLLVLAVAGLLVGARAAAPTRVERRCGWLHNPTPANGWLTDRDGEWIIAVQMGFQAAGMDRLPAFARGQWVVTNAGEHGYGCACVDAVVDRRSHRISRVVAARPLPLRQCRSDRRLPRISG